MDVSEFKAWFEGFTEDMPKPPNAKQWKRIKARVKQVDGTPTTERFFHDHYWRPYAPYWSYNTCGTSLNWSYTTCGTSLTSAKLAVMEQQFTSNGIVSNMTAEALGAGLDSGYAFTALGKAEAQSIAA